MESYKLIKEYPGSPKLGIVITRKNKGYFFKDAEQNVHYVGFIEDYSEFWEKQAEQLYISNCGTPIYAGQEFWGINIVTWGPFKTIAKHGVSELQNFKFGKFLKKEDADMYILLHRPKYSLTEIQIFCGDLGHPMEISDIVYRLKEVKNED